MYMHVPRSSDGVHACRMHGRVCVAMYVCAPALLLTLLVVAGGAVRLRLALSCLHLDGQALPLAPVPRLSHTCSQRRRVSPS
jgi:hypothetical protein